MKDIRKTDALYSRSNKVLSCSLGEEEVILDPQSNIYIGLNPTAAVLWRELSKPTCLEKLVSKVTSEFNVDSNTAAQDIAEALAELEKRELIVRKQL